MRLSQTTDYALRIVSHLARLPEGEVAEAKLIAQQEVIPLRFLLKLMRQLIKAGIVKSFRGVHGGYALARPAQRITLLDVVEAVEGPVHINRCLLDPEYCSKKAASYCEVHRVLEKIQYLLVKELGSVTFADLVKKHDSKSR